ncbi:MAG: M23 family metallopeptidase [Candidatus Paceibacterota bacterium]
MTHILTVAALVGLALFLLVLTTLDSRADADTGGITATSGDINLQTLALHRPSQSAKQELGLGGPDLNIVGDAAVVAPKSPTTGEDADLNGLHSNRKQASIYVVRAGDTLGEVAEMFGVSVNTIVWANDISGSTISPDDVLVILPVSGVRHDVEDGDTLATLAKRYDSSVAEIRDYNELDKEDVLSIGAIIDIPGGKMPKQAPARAQSSGSYVAAGGAVTSAAQTNVSGYFIHPVPGSVVTQRLHGYNAVDFAALRGTSIVAAASGQVTKSVGSGWNGGYGNFVVIRHPNGTETLYSHLSSVIVSHGQNIVQGQVIGYIGSTGRSTGPHLHFEVRGASNPFN